MITGTIYIHKNKINGKCYVGQTLRKPRQRWGTNGCNYVKSLKFYPAIKKYGWDNFEHIILPQIYHTQEELNQAEIDMIAELDSFNNGYNMTKGGLVLKNTEPYVKKQKKEKPKKEKYVFTEERKKKLSLLMTEEHKKKMYEARKHKYGPLSQETKDKIRKTNTGKTVSAKVRQKISLKLIGKERPDIKKPVLQLTKSGERVRTWESEKQARNELKISHISSCCTGKRKTAGGFIWQFI